MKEVVTMKMHETIEDRREGSAAFCPILWAMVQEVATGSILLGKP